jgi:hypothetical protein
MVHLDCIKKLLKKTLWFTIQSSTFLNLKIYIYEDGKKKIVDEIWMVMHELHWLDEMWTMMDEIYNVRSISTIMDE